MIGVLDRAFGYDSKELGLDSRSGFCFPQNLEVPNYVYFRTSELGGSTERTSERSIINEIIPPRTSRLEGWTQLKPNPTLLAHLRPFLLTWKSKVDVILMTN